MNGGVDHRRTWARRETPTLRRLCKPILGTKLMQFGRRVFLIAGIAGLILTVPAYFLEGLTATINPSAVEHPEFYYGFVGVVVVWQLVYVLIGLNPVRFRPVMPLAALAKLSFVGTVVTLFVMERIRPLWLGFGVFDGTFAVLFLVSYARTPRERPVE